jgi:thiamine-monophosphate kinase
VPLGEFELIERYFRAVGARRVDVVRGVGDDAAVLASSADLQLVAAIDTLVEGVHFPTGTPAASIGHRALAVNLSDLAAMGAQPAWALLALTLPQSDPAWLQEFARGFGELAHAHDVALVGGDTTRGPLCVTVQVLGHVPNGAALLRSTAAPDDVLCASGTFGDAAGGLQVERARGVARDDDARYLRARFLYPEPRCALGVQLRRYASACIDVSDGLAADSGKLAAASGCGVELELAALPVSDALVRTCGADRARELALSGGDDCELLFTVPSASLGALEGEIPSGRHGWRRIGRVCERRGVFLVRDGAVTQVSPQGYDHFAGG